jgi:hypothetical protein
MIPWSSANWRQKKMSAFFDGIFFEPPGWPQQIALKNLPTNT